MIRRTWLAGALLATGLQAAAPAGAQLPDTAAYRSVVASVHPRGTVVAAVVRIPVGSASDPQGLEGTAWMLGQLLADQANRALAPGATVAVSVRRDESRYTLLALPEAWPEAWRRLEAVLFRDPLGGGHVEERRSQALDALAFDAGSPVRGFELESARLIAPPGHPWGRPVLGTPETVQRLSIPGLETYRDAHYAPAVSAVAVVGPRRLLPSRPASGTAVLTPGDSLSASAGPAWEEGARVVRIQDITNSWVVVAWPVAPGVGRTSLEFLRHLLHEELDPSPPDPDRFSVDVRLEDTPAGTVLLVEAAVFPEAAERWEARILQARERLGRDVMNEDFLGWRRRRFRTARLLVEAAPEEEARRLALDVAREGRVRDLSLEIWELDGRNLLRAARSLGPPRVLRLGPDLGLDQGGR